jgi:hypothetical protein
VLYQKNKWIAGKRWWPLLFLVLFLLTGCGSRLADYLPWQDSDDGWELLDHLDEGNRLFMAGDYSAAAAIYENLKETGDQEVIRPALYGLACSRFMMAGNRQEYLDAIEVFELWQRISPATPKQEDPRMLLVLFPEPDSGEEESDEDALSDPEQNKLMWFFNSREKIDELEAKIIRLQKEVAAYESHKESMKELAAVNRAQRDALEAKEASTRAMAKELAKLREQIHTLETIDQEIQEKKQEISSP